MVSSLRLPITADNCFLSYPTGETIPVEHKVIVGLKIGKYSLNLCTWQVLEMNVFCRFFFENQIRRSFYFRFLEDVVEGPKTYVLSNESHKRNGSTLFDRILRKEF